MPDWLADFLKRVEELSWWEALLISVVLFLVTFFGSIAVVTAVLVRLPETYFSEQHPHTFLWAERQPLMRWAAIIGKNLLGVVLVLVGIIMSLPGVPGQGILTILLGVMMLDFPGKRRLERKLVSWPRVLKSVNQLRARGLPSRRSCWMANSTRRPRPDRKQFKREFFLRIIENQTMFSFTTVALLAILPAAEPAVAADVVIRGATLYDGSGQPGQKGDLAIRGDRIVAVGSFTLTGKPREIDGVGLVVAPGFIDLHTHSDTPLTQPATKANLCYLMQGVTTVVTGNCGFGPTDVAAYFKTLETNQTGSNVIHQVPHNAVRQKVMGNANRVPTVSELKKMEALVDQGMKDGAWSLSTGLIYNPGTYAKTEELITLARVVARHGGFYASHIRDENTGLLASIDEILRIGQEAKLPVHISHMKASGRTAWGKAADAIALVEQARARGQVVTADQYPYVASSTSLAAMVVPPRFREGTQEEFLARLDDPETGPKLRKAIEERIDGRQGGDSLRIAAYAKNPSWQGLSLATIADREKKSVLDVVLAIERSGGASVVSFGMNEEEVRLIMKQKFVATASDGSSQVPGPTIPHPRSYGCFPRKIGRYAIQDKVLPLEQALRSASGLPADILKLPERGYLKPGYFADVVVFDPETFRDLATYEQPHQYATGVRYLFVNGQLAIDQGKSTGTLAGKVIRHVSTAPSGK